MTYSITRFLKNGSIAAIAAATLILGAPAIAQDSGGTHGSSQGGQGQGGQGQGGQGQGGQRGQGGSGQGGGTTADQAGSAADQDAASQGGTARGGGRGGKSMDEIMRDLGGEEDTSDSDRPDYAGQKGGPTDKGGRPSTYGSKKGDMFGDLYVILRDDNGVPILNDQGFVQPIDADGNLIPLDEEGAPIDPSLAQEVELGRLNAGRSPQQVLDRRADEVITLLNTATAISLDPAGRLVLTVDGVDKTIDSPLENLAIYVALLTTGTIPGVTDLPGTEYDALVDGVFTADDLKFAAAFLAAASDKSDTLTLDEVAYIDAFLGINTTTVGTVTYSNIDYSNFSYDRSDTYESVTAYVLVLQPDGTTWAPETVNIYETIFDGMDYTGGGTLSSFAQAAEDARLIIDFIHEYEVPVSQ